MPDSLRCHGLQPTRLLCPWNFPGNNTGVGCHSILQGIFLTQGLNLRLLHWQADSVSLSHRRLRKRRKQPRINKLPLTSHDTLAPLLTSVVLLCPCLQNEILRQLFPLVKKNHIFWHYKKNLNRKIFSVLWPFSPRCTWCIHISKSEVTQPCANLCNPMDCSLPGSYVHGIFQASVLEWVAISFSRGFSQPRDRTWVSCTASRFFNEWATREAHFLR